MAEVIDLSPGIVRLDYEEFEINVTNPDGSPRDISTDILTFTARINWNDSSPVFIKSSQNTAQIDKLNPTEGIAKMFITGDETGGITKNTSLKCTLVVADTLGRENTTFYKLPVSWRQ